MADYIYLLENRLSLAQRQTLTAIRDLVRPMGLTLFLTGGAVRDLTGGASVRDLDVTIQGNALKLRKEVEKAGGFIVGEFEPAQALYAVFPGGVRVEISSAHSVTFPKPGKPVYVPSSILDDLRHRDFTANAMAISLNDGSYGLLMDPLNGVADIENRQLRLVSNYGFIEEPSRLVRAARLISRLSWRMEERTQARYETAREEKYISALSAFQRGYELEEIAQEEDPLRALRVLESEGWMKELYPAWSASKANTNALSDLHAKAGELQQQGILAYPAALAFPFLTAKMQPKDVATLKTMFPRQGFVEQIADTENKSKDFQARFSSKEFAAPSAAWRLLHTTDPETVLSLYVSGKSASVQNKFKAFLTEWPTARQRLPYQVLTEMRITPDLPIYYDLLDMLFFELMDGKLGTVEELKAYMEPYSPPAPPPPINLRRARAKKEAKAPRGKGKKALAAAAILRAEGAEPMSLPNEVGDVPVGSAPQRDGDEPRPSKKAIPREKVAPVKVVEVKSSPKPVVKAVPVQPAPVKPAPVKPAPAKSAPVKKAPPAKNAAVKMVVPAKKATPAKKTVPAKKTPSKSVAKPAAKKTVTKTAVAKKAVPAKKTPSKKTPAKKKTVAPKTVLALKKAVPKKVVGKKPQAKKTPTKTPAAKTKPAAKKATVNAKAAEKKAPAKKPGKR